MCIPKPDVAPSHPFPIVTGAVWDSISLQLEAERSRAAMWRVGEKLTGKLNGLGLLDIGDNSNALQQLKGLPAPKCQRSREIPQIAIV
jgi:hypothetical protein